MSHNSPKKMKIWPTSLKPFGLEKRLLWKGQVKTMMTQGTDLGKRRKTVKIEIKYGQSKSLIDISISR